MNWDEAEQRFAEVLPTYEQRAEQTRLAHTIEESLEQGEHLMAQAGTGVGKSFAALIPAIAHAKATDTTVVVSTATKALQGQYAGKDVPFLQEHLEPFNFAVLKGRSNYLCRQKLSELGDTAVFNQTSLLEEIDSVENHTGDLDTVITELDPRDRSKLVATSDECPGKNECPFGSICFAEVAKQRAKESEVVVVNHSTLIADLQVREKSEGWASLLPEFDAVIVDEAHELEDYTTNALGAEFTEKSLTRLATEAGQFLGNHQSIGPLSNTARYLFETLSQIRGRESTRKLGLGLIVEHQENFLEVLGELNQLRIAISSVSVYGDDARKLRQKRLVRQFQSAEKRLSGIVLADADEMIRWIEYDAKRDTTLLKYAPLQVGPWLARTLWSRSAVLLSATLAVGNDFSFLAERLGLPGYRAFDAGTPFDYAKQSRIYIPANCEASAANKDRWQARLIAETAEMVQAAGGRALLLFTSNSSLQAAYEALSPSFEAQGLTVLKQGDAPHAVLSKTFTADETSVLFALKSFMTGFSVEGDALRLVVLDKLPFSVPTDVIFNARSEVIDKKATNTWVDGAFPKLAVPTMALTLLQAFGRLIRTKSDEGLVAIMDSRLETKKYGKTMQKALPGSTKLNTLAEARSYLQELTERRSS